VAFDAARPVPWKRLLTFIAIYSMIVLGLFAIIRPSQVARSLPGVVVGGTVALCLMAILTKFGWNPTMLRSRDEIAEARAQRAAAKAKPAPSSSGKSAGRSSTADAVENADDGPRAKPPPTKRTSTGATNNPRRTRATRKR
jgi:hypothetical protein